MPEAILNVRKKEESATPRFVTTIDLSAFDQHEAGKIVNFNFLDRYATTILPGPISVSDRGQMADGQLPIVASGGIDGVVWGYYSLAARQSRNEQATCVRGLYAPDRNALLRTRLNYALTVDPFFSYGIPLSQIIVQLNDLWKHEQPTAQTMFREIRYETHDRGEDALQPAVSAWLLDKARVLGITPRSLRGLVASAGMLDIDLRTRVVIESEADETEVRGLPIGFVGYTTARLIGLNFVEDRPLQGKLFDILSTVHLSQKAAADIVQYAKRMYAEGVQPDELTEKISILVSLQSESEDHSDARIVPSSEPVLQPHLDELSWPRFAEALIANPQTPASAVRVLFHTFNGAYTEEAIAEMLGHLKEKRRRLLLLLTAGHMSHQQAARCFGVTPNAIRVAETNTYDALSHYLQHGPPERKPSTRRRASATPKIPTTRQKKPAEPNRPQVDDAVLVARAQSGDHAAFGELYDRHYIRIYKYLYHRLRDTEAAQELTSDVFIKAMGSLGSLEERGSSFAPWLYRIASNSVIDYFRFMHRSGYSLLPLDDWRLSNWGGEDNEGPSFEALASHHALRMALAGLTEDQMQVISMKFEDGLSYQEIAEALGKSVGAIKSLQHRALATLGRILGEQGELPV